MAKERIRHLFLLLYFCAVPLVAEDLLKQCESALKTPSDAIKICEENRRLSSNENERFELTLAIVNANIHLGKLEDAQVSLSDLLNNPNLSNNLTLHYRVLRRQGILFYRQHHYVKALNAFKHTIELATQLDNQEFLANAYNDQGNAYQQMGDFESALASFFKSLQQKELLGLENKVAISLNNIGNVFRDLNDFEKAMEYYQRAFQKYQQQGNEAKLAHIRENIGVILMQQNKYNDAQKVFEESLKHFNNMNVISDQFRIKLLLAELHLKTQKNLNALNHLQEAKKILQGQLSNAQWKKWNLIYAEYLIQQNALEEAEQLLISTLNNEQLNITRAEKLDVYEKILLTLSRQKKYAELYDYFGPYQLLYKERVNASYSKKVAYLSSRLEINERESQIKSLEQTNKINQLHIQQQRWLISSIALASLIFFLLLFWFFHRRHQLAEFKSRARMIELENQVKYHVEAEQHLKTSQKQLEHILNASNEALLAVNSRNQSVFANQAMLSLTGFDETQLLAIPIAQWITFSNNEFPFPEDNQVHHIENLNVKKSSGDNMVCHAWFTPLELEEELCVITLQLQSTQPSTQSVQSPQFLQQVTLGRKALDRLGDIIYQNSQNIEQSDNTISTELDVIKSSLSKLAKIVEPPNNHEQFRHQLVHLMFLALSIWEKSTSESKLELAEKSGIWRVSIDDGRLRTRSLDRYLSIDKLPKHPRWREVVRTCHYILSHCELDDDSRKSLNSEVENMMQLIKLKSLN